MLRSCCALLALLALHVEMARAGMASAPMLDRGAMTTVYPGDSDIVTAYAMEMARYRLALSTQVGDSNLPSLWNQGSCGPNFARGHGALQTAACCKALQVTPDSA